MENKTFQKVGSALTIEGMQNVINEYFFSESYLVISNTVKGSFTIYHPTYKYFQSVNKNFKVVFEKNRFVFMQNT